MTLTFARWLDRAGYLFVLVLVLGPFFYLDRALEEPFLVSSEWLLTVTAWGLAVVVAASRALSGRVVLGGGDRLLRWSSAALLAWMLLSAMLGIKPAAHLSYVSTVAAFLVGVQSFIGWVEHAPERRSRYVMVLLTTLAGLECALGLAQYFKASFLQHEIGNGFGPLGGWLHAVGAAVGGKAAHGQAFGTLGNRNYLSEMLVLIAPVLAGWAFTLRAIAARGLVLAVALASLAVILLNATRSALLGLVIGLMLATALIVGQSLWSTQTKAWLRRQWPVVALSFIIVLGVGVLGSQRLLDKLNKGMDDASIGSRIFNTQAAGHLWMAHPILGTGVGSYQLRNVAELAVMYPDGVPASGLARFYQLHNDPLQALVEVGVVGFLASLLIGVLWLRHVRRARDLPMPWRFGLVTGVTALWVASLFGFPFHIPATAMLVLLVMGLATTRSVEEEPDLAGDSRRWGYAMVAIAVIGATGWLGTTRGAGMVYAASHHDFLGRRAKGDRQTPAAETLYELAAREDRFKATHAYHAMAAFGRKQKAEEVLRVYDAYVDEGFGMDAELLRANALRYVGRLDEARESFRKVAAFYPPKARNRKLAERRLKELEKGESTPATRPRKKP